MNWVDVIKDIVVSGLAAFGGAWAAFLFESRRARRKEHDDQYRALRFAHFTATSQYQQLITINDRYIKTVRDIDEAWLQLHPLTLGPEAPQLNTSDLAFLLDGTDPDLLNRLTVGQQRYQAVRAIVSTRNDKHAALQRRAAELQAHGVEVLEGENVALGLGKDLVKQVRELTESLFVAMDDALSLVQENVAGLESFAARQFPKRRTPRTEIVPIEQRR